MLKSLLYIIIFCGFTAVVSAQTVKTANLDSLIAEALRNNPRIHTAREESAAAYTRIRQNTSFEPPQVGIEFYQTPISSFPNPIRNGLETDFSVQQSFPFPGKRAAMGNAARNSAAMIERNIGTLERQVIREMKSAYYAMYLADRTLVLNEENQDLMRELLTVTSRQYEVGKGKQSDILKAQTELSLLALSGINLKRAKKNAAAKINILAGRGAGDSLGTGEDIEKILPAWPVDRLDSLAFENRRELQAIRYGIIMKEAELAVSLKERMPDFMMRLIYKDMTMSGKDFWSTMFGFTIPESFWSRGKVRSKIEESRIAIRKAQAEYANMKNSVLLEVHEAHENVQADLRTFEYCRSTLVPQTEQNLQTAIDGYRAGTVDFMTVIDAARTLLLVKQSHETAVVNYMDSQADLEQAVGMDSDQIGKNLH